MERWYARSCPGSLCSPGADADGADDADDDFEMRSDGKSDRDGSGGELAEQSALLRDAGVEGTPEFLLGKIKIDEAAKFPRTTEGEIYNLTSRRQMPFSSSN